MSKKKSTVLSKKLDKAQPEQLNGWNEAIYDAEQKIQAAKRRIAGLKMSIRSFEQLRDSGAPFPSSKQAQSEAENDAAQ
jgi:hypothetical protein